MKAKKLSRIFFNRPTLQVAEELLGKLLVFKGFQGIITETEAYFGFDDPASHAFKGRTPRTELMFGKAGMSYVYLIYGMYHCLNIVTETEGFPAAVLIRGLRLVEGLNAGKAGKSGKESIHLNGPGKLCKTLGITRADNNVDMIRCPDFYVACVSQTLDFVTTPRIGIKVGTDKLWRFLMK